MYKQRVSNIAVCLFIENIYIYWPASYYELLQLIKQCPTGHTEALARMYVTCRQKFPIDAEKRDSVIAVGGVDMNSSGVGIGSFDSTTECLIIYLMLTNNYN